MKNIDQATIDTLITQNSALSQRIQQLESETLDLRIRHTGFEKYFSERTQDIYRHHRGAIYRLQFGEATKADIGDVQVRRDLFLTLVSGLPGCEPLMILHPHNGLGTGIRVLILGSGGIGDCIGLTYIAAIMKSFLCVDYLAIGFEGAQVHEIFTGNKIADTVVCLSHENRDKFFSIATSIDIFDLVLDVRYTALPFFPPLSRISAQMQSIMISHSRQWHQYNVFDWPHLNNLFAKKLCAQGLNAYNALPASIGLPIETMMPILDVEPKAPLQFRTLLAYGKPIVCLGVGSDAKMSKSNGISTKSLPMPTMEKLVAELKAKGIVTVQLGAAHEPLIKGVAHDFRGLLTVRESAAILKLSICFVGTEGGLVHLAKAVGTASVVAFGPTPVEFFGYEDNINLSQGECQGCWWTTREWMTKCISEGASHGCMMGIDVDRLVAGVDTLCKQASELDYEIAVVPHESLELTCDNLQMLTAFINTQVGLQQGGWYESLIEPLFDSDESGLFAWLNRENVAHPIRSDGEIFISVDIPASYNLKLLNIGNLISEMGKLVFVSGKDPKNPGLESNHASNIADELKNTLQCKGIKAVINKPKKMLSKSKYFVVVKRA